MTQTTEPSLALQMAMLIVKRCRDEGSRARKDGVEANSCPYDETDELERSGWLDGWSKP